MFSSIFSAALVATYLPPADIQGMPVAIELPSPQAATDPNALPIVVQMNAPDKSCWLDVASGQAWVICRRVLSEETTKQEKPMSFYYPVPVFKVDEDEGYAIIMGNHAKFLYNLFSGPGTYQDGRRKAQLPAV